MKKLYFIFIITVIVCACKPSDNNIKSTTETDQPAYDSLLAQQYGADEYGMKQYVMAFLKRGPNPSKDSLEASQLQKAHLQNIMRLAEEGKLVIAGPFLDDGEIRGIYIFDVKTIEEAQELTETDPAIQNGILIMELHPWYGSAALMALPEIHTKLEKRSIID